ncbi:hypothetical protein PHYSODRAFT_507014 [Phytophthora sojae]|uniref:Uncharacterized protein n=1 Tax=Phytophthora sojae (strain P6497) TaxID=1094619 RepID=G4ZNX0_PHYSP|nr:hypothetical protein PHYSODRAFT_507014 [Phytophthora sojae]EGZ15437.1 hypothetical protein PHYSODRAFT_507014 [Phytophthora sojae]|eukprot:XP_009529186.1 hypothetical protein PHYSODRAFT_507014 [Phytophthora sojae]
MSNAGAGNVQGQPQQQAQPAVNPARASNKAPRFEGTFELYRAKLELYLAERDSWAVVSGGETRHATDVGLQRQYDERDRIARAAILRGLRGCKNDDAAKVCGMATAAEMWNTLVADNTQRDFSYAVLLRRPNCIKPLIMRANYWPSTSRQ